MVLYGCPANMNACILPCLDLLRESSLPPNPEKTQIWLSEQHCIDTYPVLRSMCVVPDGLVICGHTLSGCPSDTEVPLGGNSFVHAWCSQKIDCERRECRKLLQLQDSGLPSHALQTLFMLFRLLFPSMLLHLFRALPANMGRSMAESMMDILLTFNYV